MADYFRIDVGGTFVKYGVVATDGTVISTDSCPTPHTDHRGFTSFLARLVPDNVAGIAKRYGLVYIDTTDEEQVAANYDLSKISLNRIRNDRQI